jgi:hypothetical protein
MNEMRSGADWLVSLSGSIIVSMNATTSPSLLPSCSVILPPPA